MAFKTTLQKTAAKAGLDAILAKFEVGTAANVLIQIYNGTQPDSPDAAITTQTKLAEFDVGTGTAFDAAATGTGTVDAGYMVASLQGTPLSDTSADATGTASWFRAVDKDANGVIDGSVGSGTGDFDMMIDNTSINAGQTVKLNSWKVRFPYK